MIKSKIKTDWFKKLGVADDEPPRYVFVGKEEWGQFSTRFDQDGHIIFHPIKPYGEVGQQPHKIKREDSTNPRKKRRLMNNNDDDDDQDMMEANNQSYVQIDNGAMLHFMDIPLENNYILHWLPRDAFAESVQQTPRDQRLLFVQSFIINGCTDFPSPDYHPKEATPEVIDRVHQKLDKLVTLFDQLKVDKCDTARIKKPKPSAKAKKSMKKKSKKANKQTAEKIAAYKARWCAKRSKIRPLINGYKTENLKEEVEEQQLLQTASDTDYNPYGFKDEELYQITALAELRDYEAREVIRAFCTGYKAKVKALNLSDALGVIPCQHAHSRPETKKKGEPTNSKASRSFYALATLCAQLICAMESVDKSNKKQEVEALYT